MNNGATEALSRKERSTEMDIGMDQYLSRHQRMLLSCHRPFLVALKCFVRRLRCRHKHTFTFTPDEVFWSYEGRNKGRMHHGAKVECCMDCGHVWAENYAE